MPSWSLWLIAVLATGIIFLLARWQVYTQTLPGGLIFEAARITDYPSLDQFAVEQGTEALTALGFEALDDTLLTAEQGKLNQQFSRLLWHPAHHCYAQLCTAFDRSPQMIAIVSLFADNWSLTTTTQRANALGTLTRLSRSAWYCEPQASTRELLSDHLRQREQMTLAQTLQLATDGEAESFYVKAKEQTFRRKQVIRRQMLLFSFIKGMLASIRPKKAWDGVLKSKGDRKSEIAVAKRDHEGTDTPADVPPATDNLSPSVTNPDAPVEPPTPPEDKPTGIDF
ncbi:MAG: hypothetical protein AAF921_05515 [Cyanobacteria bacterium P01_D01_bin.44]